MKKKKEWSWLDQMEFQLPAGTDCWDCLNGDNSKPHIRKHLRTHSIPGSLIQNALRYFNRRVDRKAFEDPASIRRVLRRYFNRVLNPEKKEGA